MNVSTLFYIIFQPLPGDSSQDRYSSKDWKTLQAVELRKLKGLSRLPFVGKPLTATLLHWNNLAWEPLFLCTKSLPYNIACSWKLPIFLLWILGLFYRAKFISCLHVYFAIADSSLDEIITFIILTKLFSELCTVSVSLRVFAWGTDSTVSVLRVFVLV